jgi:hypothetical protein
MGVKMITDPPTTTVTTLQSSRQILKYTGDDENEAFTTLHHNPASKCTAGSTSRSAAPAGQLNSLNLEQMALKQVSDVRVYSKGGSKNCFPRLCMCLSIYQVRQSTHPPPHRDTHPGLHS